MWEISNSQNLESGASADKFVVASKKCSCSNNLTIINFRVGILSWDEINIKVHLNPPRSVACTYASSALGLVCNSLAPCYGTLTTRVCK